MAFLPQMHSLSQEQTVAVEKDLFNKVPQDYITNYQWKLKIAKTLPNLRKDWKHLFGESYDMNPKIINEQYKV